MKGLIALPMAALVLGTGSPVQETAVGDREAGRLAYVETGCSACHGLQGQGAGNTGSRLAPDPIPFPAFSAYIRQPTGNMPPYTAAVLGPDALADMYAFLESIPDPPDADSILPAP